VTSTLPRDDAVSITSTYTDIGLRLKKTRAYTCTRHLPGSAISRWTLPCQLNVKVICSVGLGLRVSDKEERMDPYLFSSQFLLQHNSATADMSSINADPC